MYTNLINKPRVVILSAFITPMRSGAEACAEEVAARLQNDYDITIVAARMDRKLPKHGTLESGVRVIRVGIGTGIDKWLYLILAPLAARRLNPDLIHAVLESYAGFALAKCRWICPHAKRVLTCQSTNTTLLVGRMHRIAHAVTVISKVLQQRATNFGYKSTLIPNGIELENLQDTAKRVPKVPGRMLFVGRLEPMKGIDTLLHALVPLLSNADWELHVVGDGSQRDTLKKLSKSLGLQDRVRFFGRLTGPLLLNEYAEAQIFCGLSRSEALGNVFLEAQAAGCAVVATNTGGIPDIVHDQETGLLVKPDDAQTATKAITQLLTNPELRTKLSEAGKANAANYDWDAIAPQYAKMYKALLK